MRSVKKICVVVNSYPFNGIAMQPFVEQLVVTLIDSGVDCDVVVPRSITQNVIRKTTLPPKIYQAITPKNNKYQVYFPRHITVSSIDGALGGIFAKINYLTFAGAVKKVVKKYGINPDIFYGHFFYPGGLTAAELSAVYNRPYFVACGENYFTSLDKMGSNWVKDKLKNISGVIAVSSNNKNELIKRGYVREEKVGVFINSIDSNMFYPRDKLEMRQKYNFDKDAFIVCFVGRFADVKGPKRLSAALDQIDEVNSIFLGSGSNYPDCSNILYCGAVSHDQVPEYLSLSDVFVLPTLAEGCCNAIIEAMACGLPIISSNLPFNDDILDDSCSIRIDPTDIDAIRNAIVYLKDNKGERLKMAAAALAKAGGLSIGKRAENILRFIGGMMEHEA